MIINFNNQYLEPRINAEGLQSLTDIEKLWVRTGGKGGQLENWKRNPEVMGLIAVREIHVVTKNGGCANDRGTWGCQEAVIEYASYCSPEFARAIRRSFAELAKGNLIDAAQIANRVAIDPALIEKSYQQAKALNAAIPEWADGQGIPLIQAQARVWGSIIAANMTGYKSARKLKEDLNVDSVPDLFRQPEMYEHIGGLMFIMEQLTEALTLGMEWDWMVRMFGRKDILEARAKRHAAREAKEAREMAAFEEAQAEGVEF